MLEVACLSSLAGSKMCKSNVSVQSVVLMLHDVDTFSQDKLLATTDEVLDKYRRYYLTTVLEGGYGQKFHHYVQEGTILRNRQLLLEGVGKLQALANMKLGIKSSTCLLQFPIAEVTRDLWDKQLQIEPPDNKLRLQVTRGCSLELQTHGSQHIWVIFSIHELQALWDPGGIKSGLGASRNSSGGEYHVLVWAGPQYMG